MHWTLDDIDWGAFDPARVDPDILKVVKAAALVEGNADDYVRYLCNVFSDDPAFQQAARRWGEEEAQHGEALAAWAATADPAYDYADARRLFRAGFSLPLDIAQSVRGSRSGELIARCVVECGTSSFYSAIRDATDEPVLRQICHRIAGDEFRHYRLFHNHLRRYLEREPLSFRARLAVAVGRVTETSDDELAFAYYCGNRVAGVYDRGACAKAYEYRAVRLYRAGHVARLVAMVAKAIGISPRGRLCLYAQWLVWWLMRFRIKRLTWQRVGAAP